MWWFASNLLVPISCVLATMKDPQYLHHVLTTVVGPKLFYDLPLLTSRFMRKIALHKECMVTRNKAKSQRRLCWTMMRPTITICWFVTGTPEISFHVHVQFQFFCKSHLICHLMSSISTQKHLRQNFRKNLGAVASSRNAPRLITLRTHWPFWKPAMKDKPQKRCFRQGAPDGCERSFSRSLHISVGFAHFVYLLVTDMCQSTECWFQNIIMSTSTGEDYTILPWLYGSIWYLSTGSQPPPCTARMKKLFHHSIQQSWRLDDSATHPTLNFPGLAYGPIEIATFALR